MNATLKFDELTFDQPSFERHIDYADRYLGSAAEKGVRLAICIEDAGFMLALFFAVKRRNSSLLLIHPATPYSAAKRQAERADCTHLLYHKREIEHFGDASSQNAGKLLQFSSGTTGEPKCIARDWASIDAEIVSYIANFPEPAEMSPIIACPITHSYGLICGVLVGLERGRPVHVVATGNPKYVINALRQVEKPLLLSSPALLHMIARLLPKDEMIHASMSSGTVMPQPWLDTIRARSTHMFQQYGCSEAGCIAINPDVQRADEIGFLLPHHQALQLGTVEAPAELILKSFGSEIQTRDMIHASATDGMLTFLSRLDDLINVAGLNVYPKDVEDSAMTMAGISDAVAIRRDDAFAGERLVLLYSSPLAISPEQLRTYLMPRLASFQMPSELSHVDQVPRLANGKINRRDIATAYAAGLLNQPLKETA